MFDMLWASLKIMKLDNLLRLIPLSNEGHALLKAFVISNTKLNSDLPAMSEKQTNSKTVPRSSDAKEADIQLCISYFSCRRI